MDAADLSDRALTIIEDSHLRDPGKIYFKVGVISPKFKRTTE